MKIRFLNSISLVLVAVFMFTMTPLTGSAATSGSNTFDAPPAPVESVKKVVSSSSGTTTGTTTTANKTNPPAEVSLFGFKQAEVSAIYKGYSGKFMVSPISDNSNFVSAVNSLENNSNVKKVTVDTTKAAQNIEASYLAVFKNGVRRVYALIGNNTLQIGDEYYSVPAESYTKLKTIYTTDYKMAKFAQWLIYMKPSNVTNLYYETGGEKVELDAKYLSQVVQLIRGIRVTSGESYSPKLEDFKPGNGNTRITIQFGENGSYALLIKGNTMYVESDEFHIGCKHTIVSADITKIVNALKDPANNLVA